MPTAYVLINTEEYDPQFIKTLKALKGVEEAYPVYGVYDVIAKTSAETMNELKATHDKMRRLKKVRQTLTMITHEE